MSDGVQTLYLLERDSDKKQSQNRRMKTAYLFLILLCYTITTKQLIKKLFYF